MAAKRGPTHSAEVRAQAIAAMLAGEAPASVAERLGVPLGTVKSWRSRDAQALVNSGAAVATDATPKRDELGRLVSEYLRESLRALRAQSELFADAEWLKKQSAAELAILHGVLNDKVVRILSALRNNEGGDGE